MQKVTTLLALVLSAGLVGAEQPTAAGAKRVSAEALRAQIAALKPARVAWREIAWKSCLLEGLEESRNRRKPVLLWVFIDRPADDARC